jgi:transcriptional regulator with XRE-family HTH domain
VQLLEHLNHEMTGAELRQIRQQAGCTQVELAYLIDINPVTLSNYERDVLRIPTRLAILMRLLAQS